MPPAMMVGSTATAIHKVLGHLRQTTVLSQDLLTKQLQIHCQRKTMCYRDAS